eukprot:scaffold8032_cov267-Pinguiococcus_pyrenoidosus.AAC.1
MKGSSRTPFTNVPLLLPRSTTRATSSSLPSSPLRSSWLWPSPLSSLWSSSSDAGRVAPGNDGVGSNPRRRLNYSVWSLACTIPAPSLVTDAASIRLVHPTLGALSGCDCHERLPSRHGRVVPQVLRSQTAGLLGQDLAIPCAPHLHALHGRRYKGDEGLEPLASRLQVVAGGLPMLQRHAHQFRRLPKLVVSGGFLQARPHDPKRLVPVGVPMHQGLGRRRDELAPQLCVAHILVPGQLQENLATLQLPRLRRGAQLLLGNALGLQSALALPEPRAHRAFAGLRRLHRVLHRRERLCLASQQHARLEERAQEGVRPVKAGDGGHAGLLRRRIPLGDLVRIEVSRRAAVFTFAKDEVQAPLGLRRLILIGGHA